MFNPTPVTPTTPHLHLTSKNLAHPFALFDTQLKALLGIQPLPQGVQYTATSPAPLSQWQVDALVRHRVLENMHGSIDTVNSIVKLVDRIKGMPVGGTVKSDIEQALDALEEVSVFPSLPQDSTPPPNLTLCAGSSNHSLIKAGTCQPCLKHPRERPFTPPRPSSTRTWSQCSISRRSTSTPCTRRCSPPWPSRWWSPPSGKSGLGWPAGDWGRRKWSEKPSTLGVVDMYAGTSGLH